MKGFMIGLLNSSRMGLVTRKIKRIEGWNFQPIQEGVGCGRRLSSINIFEQ